MTDAEKVIADIGQLDAAGKAAVLVAIVSALAQPQTPAAPDELIDSREAEQILGVSVSWLHHRPKLPFRRKVGGLVKYSRAGIAQWTKRDHAA